MLLVETRILFVCSSFKHFICIMFEQVNSKRHGIPPHNCLQMSSLRARKYHAIWESHKANGWPFNCPALLHSLLVHKIVKLSISNKFFSDQWLPYVLINMISMHITMLCGYQAIILHCSSALYFRSNSIVFISTVGFSTSRVD